MSELFEAQAKALAQVVGAQIKSIREDCETKLSDLSAELEAIKREMAEQKPLDEQSIIDSVVAKIPTPKDGESVDMDEVRSIISEHFADIPIPKDGESVTVDDVAPMIAEAVVNAVSAIELPKIDMEEIKSLVDSAVSCIEVEVPVPDNGTDGKDALQIEIMPFIDEEKTYPRGTYATHNGGLWRSFEKTQGMRGWECIVNGVASVEVKQDNERQFTVEMAMSSGEPVTKAFTMPVVIDRGVYRADNSYEKGDGTTWAGSFWIAQTDAPTEKPGEGSQWRLSVKKGRDAK